MFSFGEMAEDGSPSPTCPPPAASRREDQIGPAWVRRALRPSWWGYLMGRAELSPPLQQGLVVWWWASEGRKAPICPARAQSQAETRVRVSGPIIFLRLWSETKSRGQDFTGFSGEPVGRSVRQLQTLHPAALGACWFFCPSLFKFPLPLTSLLGVHLGHFEGLWSELCAF